MKVLIAFGLFLLTAFLFGAGFYLSINDKSSWGYFLGAGVFTFLISAAVSAGMVEDKKQKDEDDDEDDTELVVKR